MGYIVRSQYGAFCAVCQHHLGFEEDSFDCCDVCGGEGWPEEHDDDPYEVATEGENWTEIRLKDPAARSETTTGGQ